MRKRKKKNLNKILLSIHQRDFFRLFFLLSVNETTSFNHFFLHYVVTSHYGYGLYYMYRTIFTVMRRCNFRSYRFFTFRAFRVSPIQVSVQDYYVSMYVEFLRGAHKALLQGINIFYDKNLNCFFFK